MKQRPAAISEIIITRLLHPLGFRLNVQALNPNLTSILLQERTLVLLLAAMVGKQGGAESTVKVEGGMAAFTASVNA